MIKSLVTVLVQFFPDTNSKKSENQLIFNEVIGVQNYCARFLAHPVYGAFVAYIKRKKLTEPVPAVSEEIQP